MFIPLPQNISELSHFKAFHTEPCFSLFHSLYSLSVPWYPHTDTFIHLTEPSIALLLKDSLFPFYTLKELDQFHGDAFFVLPIWAVCFLWSPFCIFFHQSKSSTLWSLFIFALYLTFAISMLFCVTKSTSDDVSFPLDLLCIMTCWHRKFYCAHWCPSKHVLYLVVVKR